MSATWKLAVYTLLITYLMLVYRRLVRFFGSWIDRRPVFTLQTMLVLLVVYGLLGQDYGLPDLFWHDEPGTQAAAGVSIVLVLALMWVFDFADERRQPTAREILEAATRRAEADFLRASPPRPAPPIQPITGLTPPAAEIPSPSPKPLHEPITPPNVRRMFEGLPSRWLRSPLLTTAETPGANPQQPTLRELLKATARDAEADLSRASAVPSPTAPKPAPPPITGPTPAAEILPPSPKPPARLPGPIPPPDTQRIPEAHKPLPLLGPSFPTAAETPGDPPDAAEALPGADPSELPAAGPLDRPRLPTAPAIAEATLLHADAKPSSKLPLKGRPPSEPEPKSKDEELLEILALEPWKESDKQVYQFLDLLKGPWWRVPLPLSKVVRRLIVVTNEPTPFDTSNVIDPNVRVQSWERYDWKDNPFGRLRVKLVVVLAFFVALLSIPGIVATLDGIVRGSSRSAWSFAYLPVGAAGMLLGLYVLLGLAEFLYWLYREDLSAGGGKLIYLPGGRVERSRPPMLDLPLFLGSDRYLRGIVAWALLGILVLVVLTPTGDQMTAAGAICVLLGMWVVVSQLTNRSPLLRFGALAALLVVVGWANGRDPYKLSYPGFELADARPTLVRWDVTAKAARGEEGGASPAAASGMLVDDSKALDAWLAERRKADGRNKPKLVVVAVSGGGIAAAIWTASNLARLERFYPDFPGMVRVVTGASGGMLGASYYVATLQGPPARHTEPLLDRLVSDLAEDSLTPVVRQMVLRDLFTIVLPIRPEVDRGRVLERTWEAHTPTKADGRSSVLADPFGDLAAGEAAGWRPSLIVAPMVVEEAEPLLISNLDLAGLKAVEFFKLFPPGEGRPGPLKLSTAIRMNAAFPLVSPAACLPTDPPRRVVDAGYYDNYGVGLATSWIQKNRCWLKRSTSGVVLIQIRAYPLESHAPEDSPLHALRSGMQWLTTPIEGYTAASKRAMIAHNQEKIDAVSDWFGANAPDAPFATFVLQCPESAPLSWAITARDRADFDGLDALLMPEPVQDPRLLAVVTRAVLVAKAALIRSENRRVLAWYDPDRVKRTAMLSHYMETLIRLLEALAPGT
jgi:hypothetical protein